MSTIIHYSRFDTDTPKGKPILRKLDDSHIPAKHIELNKRIIDARDQIHAHSDLTVREARLYVKNSPHRRIVGAVQNKIYGAEELSNIDAIIDLIEQSLDSMYVEIKRLEAALETTGSGLHSCAKRIGVGP